jgi:hypothetical protein
MPGRPPQCPLQTTRARRRRAHRPSAPPPNTVDHDSRGGDRRTPSLSFNPRAPSCGSAAAARRSQTLVANPLPEFNAHRPPGVSRLRSTRLQRRPASRRWHHPCRGTSLNPQAFRRSQPSIPTESSHLFRSKPAVHSAGSQPGWRCGLRACAFGSGGGRLVKPGGLSGPQLAQ